MVAQRMMSSRGTYSPPTHPELCPFCSPSAIDDRLCRWRGACPLTFWQKAMLRKQPIVTVVYIWSVLGIVNARLVELAFQSSFCRFNKRSLFLSKRGFVACVRCRTDL
jgi:hypothetical protein